MAVKTLVCCYDALQWWRAESPSCWTTVMLGVTFLTHILWPEIDHSWWWFNVRLWRHRLLPSTRGARPGQFQNSMWDLPKSAWHSNFSFSPVLFPSLCFFWCQSEEPSLVRILHTLPITVSTSPGTPPATFQMFTNRLVTSDAPLLTFHFLLKTWARKT